VAQLKNRQSLNNKTMDSHDTHISSYESHAKVLVTLLTLTLVTVLVTWLDFGIFTVTVALSIASVKTYIVLTWFMHLKFESVFIRGMVLGVFAMFTIILIITFIDYFFR
jgi:cytochrome c oxidase subunit IV